MFVLERSIANDTSNDAKYPINHGERVKNSECQCGQFVNEVQNVDVSLLSLFARYEIPKKVSYHVLAS